MDKIIAAGRPFLGTFVACLSASIVALVGWGYWQRGVEDAIQGAVREISAVQSAILPMRGDIEAARETAQDAKRASDATAAALAKYDAERDARAIEFRKMGESVATITAEFGNIEKRLDTIDNREIQIVQTLGRLEGAKKDPSQ